MWSLPWLALVMICRMPRHREGQASSTFPAQAPADRAVLVASTWVPLILVVALLLAYTDVAAAAIISLGSLLMATASFVVLGLAKSSFEKVRFTSAARWTHDRAVGR